MAPNPSIKSQDMMKSSSRWKMEQSNITEVNNEECVEIGY